MKKTMLSVWRGCEIVYTINFTEWTIRKNKRMTIQGQIKNTPKLVFGAANKGCIGKT